MFATIIIRSASILLAAWLFFQIGAFASSFIWCSRQKRKCSISTVLPCRNIGEGAVVSTCAVVTKDCEPYTIYPGSPAVPKETREQKLTYELRRHWWFV